MKHTEVTETNTLSDKAKAYKNANGKLKANLRLNVLYLNRAELATETDKANKLDYLSAAKRSGLAEGYEQHLITQICKKLVRGLSADQIAPEVEEDPARVATICNIAKKYAPEYDVERIASELHETPKAD